MAKNNKNTNKTENAPKVDALLGDEGLTTEETIPADRMEPDTNVAFEKTDETTDTTVETIAEPTGEVEHNTVQNVEATATPTEERDASADVDPDPRWTLDVWHTVVLDKIGQPSFVLTAAMEGEDPTKEYSEPEVRSLVEKFLNTPAR